MTIFRTLPEPFASGTAVSLGMFDGLHRGHFAVLNAMKAQAAGLKTVLFTFSTEKAKPDAKTGLHLLSENLRDDLLRDFGVDYIVEPEFSDIRDLSPRQFAQDFLLHTLQAKLVFCGEDFRFGKQAAAGTDELRGFLAEGARLIVVPVLRAGNDAISTTRIRGLIQNGEIAQANELLGRPFAIDFTVEHGRKLGRTWGLPTINQAFPASFVVPKFGVYASLTVIGGAEHVSVTNVGVKPTVGSEHVLAETYIHNFTGDLYGQAVPVKLMQFLRGEKKFDSVEELRAQIAEDNKVAGELLKG